MRRLIFYAIAAVALISFVSFSTKLYRYLTSKPPEHKEASPIPQKKPPKSENKTESPKKPVLLKSKIPFVITQNRHTYIVLLKEKKVLAFADSNPEKLSKRVKRRILYRVKRAGLKNCACHKIKARRFLCLFRNGNYREAYLPLRCELLVVAEGEEETLYPKQLLSFLNSWQIAWMNIKNNFDAYAKLYHENFRNRYGNLKGWLTYRRANLKKIKYIDLIIEDPVFVKMPSAEDLFAAFFWQIYRSNIKRVDALKGLLIKYDNGTFKILTETGL